MKKIFSVIAVLALILSCLTGCGKTTNEASKYTAEPRTYVFGGSTSTGSFFVQSAAVASIWEDLGYVDTFSIEATTGSMENLLLVSEGTADFALASSLAVACANEGREPYSKVQGDLSAICYGAMSAYQFAVKADSDIYSIEDMKGRIVSTGTVGSGAEQEIRELLAALGITYDDFERVDCIGIGDGLTALKDGKVDVAFVAAGYPNASLLEACMGADLRLVEFSDSEIETLLAALNWITPVTIPGGTYAGIENDTKTVASMTLLLANENLPDEVIYAMTKALYENIETLRASNGIFDAWSFTTDMGTLIAIHPGALNYYNEAGV